MKIMIKHELPGFDKFRLIIANWVHPFLCGAVVVSVIACGAAGWLSGIICGCILPATAATVTCLRTCGSAAMKWNRFRLRLRLRPDRSLSLFLYAMRHALNTMLNAPCPPLYALSFCPGLKKLVAVDGTQGDFFDFCFPQNTDGHFDASAAERPDFAVKIGLAFDGLPIYRQDHIPCF